VTNLIIGSVLLVGYWLAWFADRNIVASDDTPEYIAFEQAFPLADALLLAVALLAVFKLLRRRPSAIVWMLALGGAGIYLCALDVLYNLEHGTYAKGGPGVIELGINVYVLASGAGAIYFGWRFRRELLAD
jgi:drug/metabolite transporter (DMT)-like permease